INKGRGDVTVEWASVDWPNQTFNPRDKWVRSLNNQVFPYRLVGKSQILFEWVNMDAWAPPILEGLRLPVVVKAAGKEHRETAKVEMVRAVPDLPPPPIRSDYAPSPGGTDEPEERGARHVGDKQR